MKKAGIGKCALVCGSVCGTGCSGCFLDGPVFVADAATGGTSAATGAATGFTG